MRFLTALIPKIAYAELTLKENLDYVISKEVWYNILLGLIPVMILMGIDKVAGDSEEEWVCEGRIWSTGTETNSTDYYCFGLGLSVNHTYEWAEFFIKNRPEWDADGNKIVDDNGEFMFKDVQGWHRDQYWMYEDGVSCSIVLHNKEIANSIWSGWWAGSESKWREWNSDINKWVVQISSHTLQCKSEYIDGELYICPKHHQHLEVYRVCGTGAWGNYDEDTMWSEPLTENGVERRGPESGLYFNCVVYPSNFSF